MELVLIWLFNILACIPMFFLSRVKHMWHGSVGEYCTEYFETDAVRRAYTLTLFIAYYVIPLFIIVVCYCLMTLSLKAKGQRDKPGRAAEANQSRNRKIARLVMVVVATFALCWGPIHLVHLQTDLGTPEYSNIFYIIKIVAHCLSYANSAINPIIYSFMSKSFRQSFREACCCKLRLVDNYKDNEPEAKRILSCSDSQPRTISVLNGGSVASALHSHDEPGECATSDPATIRLVAVNNNTNVKECTLSGEETDNNE